MKNIITPLVGLLLLTSTTFAQTTPDIKPGSFQVGEELKYKVRYGFVTAAEATLKVEAGDKTINGQPTYHLIGSGKTNSSFDFFMKVRDRYDSYVTVNELLPYLWTETIKEGSYKRSTYANFDRTNNTIQTNNKKLESVPAKVLDVISAFYYARSIDTDKLKPGDKFKLDYYIENGVSPLVATYVGKETIEVAAGKFECLKFNPSLKQGRAFKTDSKMFLWVTNDANHIPVKVEVEILVSSLKLELQGYSGLKNDLTSKK